MIKVRGRLMATTLVIVPHEDDELSVAGQLLISLSKYKTNKIYVVFATNGDTYPAMKGLRIREAIGICGILVIKIKGILDNLSFSQLLYYGKEICCTAKNKSASAGILGD